MDKKTKTNRPGVLRGLTGGGWVFPYQLAFTLLIPLRNIFLSPGTLVQRLGLKGDHNVLEIGPGPGYFSPAVARALPRGVLVLADIQREMLDLAERRLTGKGIGNVEYHLCNGIDFPFESEKFDVIFMVTVLGEIENREQYLDECFRLLRRGGLLSISEQAGDADRMSTAEIRRSVQAAGFEFEMLFGSKRNYTVNFRKGG